VLSCLISKIQKEEKISGIKTMNVPAISHIFFVDDNTVFSKIDKEEAKVVGIIFNIYQHTLRHKIN
jgi:hypothetical protein